MKSVFQSIKRLLSYSLPVKIILGFLLTALGGASFLGLLSEFAVYNYALVNGFRVPVEGIEYLKPTMTLVSLIILVVALFGFVITYLFAKVTAGLMLTPEFLLNKFSNKKMMLGNFSTLGNMRDASWMKVGLFSLFMSFLAGEFLLFVYEYSSLFSLSLSYLLKKTGIELFDERYQTALVYVACFIIYFSTFKPTLIKYVAGLAATISVIAILMVMFNATLYSEFLNKTGFGGERGIVLFTKNEQSGINGKLLIRSKEYYILLLEGKDVAEYPISKVERIEYIQTPSLWGY